MNHEEAGSLVNEWGKRLDAIRSAEKVAKTTRRDEAKKDERDLVRELLHRMGLPHHISCAFSEAISRAQPEGLPAIERMLRERGRQWTGQAKRRGPVNKVTKRSA